MDSLDLCSVCFGVRCRDAGRAFSVFKPMKEKAVVRKLRSREGFFFPWGIQRLFSIERLSTDVLYMKCSGV